MRENLRMYVAEALRLRDGGRGRLEAITRAPTAPAGVAWRVRVVLLAADAVSNTEIADRVGVSRPTVLWAFVFLTSGRGLPPGPASLTVSAYWEGYSKVSLMQH
jgi:hypothetical protein